MVDEQEKPLNTETPVPPAGDAVTADSNQDVAVSDSSAGQGAGEATPAIPGIAVLPMWCSVTRLAPNAGAASVHAVANPMGHWGSHGTTTTCWLMAKFPAA